jgi:hypothetical protein
MKHIHAKTYKICFYEVGNNMVFCIVYFAEHSVQLLICDGCSPLLSFCYNIRFNLIFLFLQFAFYISRIYLRDYTFLFITDVDAISAIIIFYFSPSFSVFW